MPFDRTDPAQVAALKTEIETDPAGQGYRAPVDFYSAGATVQMLRLLRAPSAGGETNTSTLFSGEDLLAAVVASPAEYAAVISDHPQAAIRTEFVTRMFDYVPDATGQNPGVIPGRFRAPILAIFNNQNAPTIRAAIVAEATGPMRREEVLFGDDTSLTKQDIAAALVS